MAVDKRTSGGSGAPADDETPDWTTWLRSRLERVVTPDRKGTETTDTDLASTGAAADAPSSTSGRPAAGPPDDDAVARLTEKVEALADATAACRDLIEEQGATGERLAAWVQELATVQADDERWALAVGRVVDAADEERREADERAGTALARLSSRVERIEEKLGGISTELAGLRREVTRPASTVKLGEPQLQAVAARIAAALTGPGTTNRPGDGGDRPAVVASDPGGEPVKRRPRRATSLRAVPPGSPPRRRP